MDIKLSSRQKEFLDKHKEKGYFTLTDTILLYSTENSRKTFLKRLELAELIKETETGKFEIIDHYDKLEDKRETS